MQYNQLGQSDLTVSELCLGSMTWGTQNTLEEGHAQIDLALDRGINFIDTAELYPVNPVRAETVGNTEAIIGEWFARTGRRDDVILATKVAGPNGGAVRGGAGYSGETIEAAIDASLARLKTDVIDIYQLHWPDRGSYHFRQFWKYDPAGQSREANEAHMMGVLEALERARAAGKIRHFGLSNETAWGVATWIRLAEAHGLPRVVSLQNEYSLLCRLYDGDMAETCVNEEVGMIPYSPMAVGLLSGKYAPGQAPKGSRGDLTPDLGGRISPRVWAAIDAYRAIAARHGLDAMQMGLAWVMQRPGITSPIFGATSMAQLETALGAADLTLSEEVLGEIEAAHKEHPLPF